MSTSDIDFDDVVKRSRRHSKRVEVTYLVLAIFAILVDKVYSLFGHGVHSQAMAWMFLYPLLGGVLFCSLIHLGMPRICEAATYRLSFNLYNSGIAMLTVSAFLQGILEIAGTASPYTFPLFVGGIVLTLAGLFVLTLSIRKR